jgi:hypothetical protein
LRGIASGLGRVPSAVCREVAANGGAGRYRRVPRTGGRFAWRTVPGRPGWPGARGCVRWWRPSWSCAGRRSRSRAG